MSIHSVTNDSVQIHRCLSHCAIGVSPWQLSEERAFNWDLAYSFRGLVHLHHGGKHGDM